MTAPRPPYVTQGPTGWQVHFTPSTPAVPEPSTYALALVGLAVAGIAARRRRAV